MADKRFLYILKEDETEFYRIGITHNITYRLGMLKGGNHRKLHLSYLIEFNNPSECLAAENTLHEMLKEFTTDPKLRSWYDLKGNRYQLTKHIVETFVKDGVMNITENKI